MAEVYIDIRNSEHTFQLARAKLETDPRISPTNRLIIQRYLRDAALGKTVIGRAKKRIGPARLYSYIVHLSTFIDHVKKNVDEVSQEDMEEFVEKLDAGRLLSRRSRTNGPEMTTAFAPLGERYAVDLKVTLRKFYKWLIGNNKIYPPLVEWIDTSFQVPEIAALTENEVQRMIDFSRVIRHRAIIQMLFDGGFRLGELMNIRLRHVILKSFDPSDPEKSCFFVRVPFSKTLRRTVSLPMRDTTRWLSLWLEQHPGIPELQADGTLRAFNVEEQLFPIAADAVRLMLNRLGRKALNKRVYPHLLRHSSATFWSNRLSHYKLCKRFGWTMTSKMPQRYIDREGVDELESAQLFMEQERARDIHALSVPAVPDETEGERDSASLGVAMPKDAQLDPPTSLNSPTSFDKLAFRGRRLSSVSRR